MLHIKLRILKDKIMQIETAIVHCPEDHFFQQQAVLAETLALDDEGELWLRVDKPVNCAENGSKSFDVVLNYQKAGLPFDLDILGEARMVSEEEIKSLLPGIKSTRGKDKMILRVHIIDVDYWQHKRPVFKNIAQKLQNIFSHVHTDDKQQIYPDRRMSAG